LPALTSARRTSAPSNVPLASLPTLPVATEASTAVLRLGVHHPRMRGQLAGPSSPANMPIEHLDHAARMRYRRPQWCGFCQESAVKSAVAATAWQPEAAGHPMRQRPSSPTAGTTDLRAAQAQRARSRAFWPTGSKSLLADESTFAGGQLSDPAILQILVRMHGSCTSVELSSYAAERVMNYTLASARGSVGVPSGWVFQPCKEIARCSSMR
jgi:hypothetical protein